MRGVRDHEAFLDNDSFGGPFIHGGSCRVTSV